MYIGPVFFDKDIKGLINKYHTTEWAVEKVDMLGTWSFAKTGATDLVPCKPALFGPGYIYFDPKKTKFDLKDITKIELVFQTEGILIKKDDPSRKK
jgi:hypothetical protein